MSTKWKLIHIKSKQRAEDKKTPKLPTADQLQYGEIAINYGDGIETIAIRNENDEIVKFISEKEVHKYVEKRLSELLSEMNEKSPFNIDETSIDSGEY